MKFKSVLRKAHVPDEDAIAHLRISIFVCIEKVVLSIDGEPLLRQLGSILAMPAHLKLCARLASLPGVRKENQRELPIGQFADLSGPLERRDTIHDDVLTCLAHNDAKIEKNYRPAKDRLHLFPVIFPRIVRPAPLFPFPAVRARLGEVFLGVFLPAGPLGLIISILAFIPFHFPLIIDMLVKIITAEMQHYSAFISRNCPVNR